jgi:hypothetical protein
LAKTRSSYDQTDNSHSGSQLNSRDKKKSTKKLPEEPMTPMDLQILDEAKELNFANQIVKRPRAIFCTALLFMMIFTLIAFGSSLFEINEFTERENYVWSSPVTHDYEKQYVAEAFFNQNKITMSSDKMASRSQAVNYWKACILYMNHMNSNSSTTYGLY